MTPARVQRVALLFVASAALAGLLSISCPSTADDWDGLGFLASVRSFDMRSFSPHPPGYPVYVAALRVANLIAGSALRSAYVVSITSCLFVFGVSLGLARKVFGSGPAVALASMMVGTPLAWRAFSAVGSEGLALACFVAGISALISARTCDRAGWIVGVAAGLGIGIRLSWTPLFLPALVLLPRAARTRAMCGLLLAIAAWLIPLVEHVGPAELLRLYAEHGVGHATRWGGSMVTDPGLGRFCFFARDLFVDGIGVDADALGLAIALLATTLAAAGIARWHRRGWRGARSVAFLLLPYACWILIAQNVRQQPRHVLPLVAALAAGLAIAAAQSPRLKAVGGALAVLVVIRTAMDATARKTIPPPGAQLAAFANQLQDARGVAVFGGTSIRFFTSTPLAPRAIAVSTLDEARLALTRLDESPRHVLITSEVEAAGGEPTTEVATFCRPARIDRRAPCLTVFEWSPMR